MGHLRSKIFLSYSRADTKWREAFSRQLRAFLASNDLWIDSDSIPPGSDWEAEIARGVQEARCALVLLTPAYLDMGHGARKELTLLLQQAPELKVLPVLVEDCLWKAVDGLEPTQFLRWTGCDRVVGSREELAPLAESPYPDRSVIEICERLHRELGVVGQTRPEQIDALFDATQHALGTAVELESAVHSGDFSVVYRAKMHDETVAVKAVPDAPRQNRIRRLVSDALPKVHKLTDPAFIRLRDSSLDTEPHYFVMDYVDWPTIEQRLASLPRRRVGPAEVAKVLAQVARAHRDAHRAGLLIGPLRLDSIHVNEAWEVRLSPLRIEGMLARASYMSVGQLMNWDALNHLAPEISAGEQAGTLEGERLDALEQYYLGLLGLELLLGHPPCEVRCFDDLSTRARFFEDPRPFFADGPDEHSSWAEADPALAYLLIKLLARDPRNRVGSADEVVRNFDALVADELPLCLRRQLNDDLERVKTPAFCAAFYARLFRARPGLEKRFADEGRQVAMLAAALPDLVNFDPNLPRTSRFQQLAAKHAAYGIDEADVAAFRSAFLIEIFAEFGGRAGHVEAWLAVLDRGLGALAAQLPKKA